MTTNRAVGKKIARVQLVVEGYPRFFTVGLDAENAWAIRAIPSHLSVKEKADQPERLTGQFMMESTDKQPFRILDVMGEAPRFLAFDPGSDDPRNRYTLKYDFTGLACEEMPKFVIVRTDHPNAPLIDVRVRHDPCTKISPAMPMADYRSNLGLVRPGTSMDMTLEFKKPRRPTMASVTSTDPRLVVALKDQVNDGKQLKVTTEVFFPADMEEGLFQVPIVFSDGTLSAEHVLYGWVTR
jgi:hypothetical protein